MTLFYQLTETEFDELDMVRGQVALMADLMGRCAKGVVDIEHVARFMGALLEKMETVTAAIEERDVVRAGVTPELLAGVLSLAAGEDLGAEACQALNEQLVQGMAANPAYATTFRPFITLLQQRGYAVEPSEAMPVKTRTRRSRTHLVGEGANGMNTTAIV